jgi:hypothetical protein
MSSALAHLASTPLASREWRIQNLYTITDSDGRLVPFNPNYAQRQFYNAMWYCNHILKARKLGLSTFVEILYLDDLLFSNTGLSAGIIDYTIEDAESKLSMFALAYDNLDNGDIHPHTWKIGAAIKKAIPVASRATRRFTLANGSTIRCSTSLRGTTPQRIHVSEPGKTAIWAPRKMREIINGAFNSMTPGNVRNLESTHEGGRVGDHYRLLNIAMRNEGKKLTPLDSKFHFFPWYQDTRYVLDTTGHSIRPEITRYFDRLKADHGIQCTKAQQLWYDRKHLEQGHGMKKEYPTTPGEAFEAVFEGAIYGTQMADLRAAGRITDFNLEKQHPIFTFWDIGLSDYTSVWLIQPVGRWFLVLDWFEAEGATAADMPDQMLRWENQWNKPIAAHFLPHDAETRSPNDGKSYKATLEASGLRNLITVPRTPDKWLGIGYAREILPHCWFHKSNCDTSRNSNGTAHSPDQTTEEFPSGIACLEGYQKDISAAGVQRLREMPKHDIFSHSADSFRTFAEAHRRGMINAPSTSNHTPRSIR